MSGMFFETHCMRGGHSCT